MDGVDTTLQTLINSAQNIVFFGGAGVSTESGIPDFRSEAGLFAARSAYGYSPEQILSANFFTADPTTFFEYYRNNLVHTAAEPNITHERLAALEAHGKQVDIITQNIDGLHQLAGSSRVHELHGSIWRNTCLGCGRQVDLSEILSLLDAGSPLPLCSCDGVFKPNVVLYGEALPQDTWQAAVLALQAADLLIVGGTSLSVYPAAGMLEYFMGGHIVVINKTATPADARADLVFHESLGAVFSQLDPSTP